MHFITCKFSDSFLYISYSCFFGSPENGHDQLSGTDAPGVQAYTTRPERPSRTRTLAARRKVFLAFGAKKNKPETRILAFYALKQGHNKKGCRNPSDSLMLNAIFSRFRYISTFKRLQKRLKNDFNGK